MKIKLWVAFLGLIGFLALIPAGRAVEKPLPRLLELGSEKCIPCKMMQPVLEELRKEYPGKLKVDFIDVWKKPQAAQKYKIQVIPAQIFFNSENREIFRHYGYYSKSEIIKKFRELGVKF